MKSALTAISGLRALFVLLNYIEPENRKVSKLIRGVFLYSGTDNTLKTAVTPGMGHDLWELIKRYKYRRFNNYRFKRTVVIAFIYINGGYEIDRIHTVYDSTE